MLNTQDATIMANTSEHIVGGFRIPTEFEERNGQRLYTGVGDPNRLMQSVPPFFVPPPRPNDRYLQLETVPMIEWVFTKDGIWIELASRFDREPPDFTDIFDIIKAEL